jgi:hypothetical protein
LSGNQLFRDQRLWGHAHDVADFGKCAKTILPSRLRRGVNGYVEDHQFTKAAHFRN